MNLLVLDTNFQPVLTLDVFESFIWTDRYCNYGDFEVYTAVDMSLFDALQKDYYIYSKDSEHVMIIEEKRIDTDNEMGNHLTISGRSLESILDRRIIWAPTVLTGNFQNGIKKLLDENAIIPSNSARTINNLVFQASTDPAITALTIDIQVNGENLYDVIQVLCDSNDLGFKITLNEDNEFVFQLYSGVDRSYGQTSVPYVVFSPRFENLINTSYAESKSGFKTTALVAGEPVSTEENAPLKTTVAEIETEDPWTGLDRREMYVNAGDVRSKVGEETLSPATYLSHLEEKGYEALMDALQLPLFEGQVDTTMLFKYGMDFYMGDIVQLRNEYGMEARSRVTEMVHSISTSGVDIYPTFTAVD